MSWRFAANDDLRRARLEEYAPLARSGVVLHYVLDGKERLLFGLRSGELSNDRFLFTTLVYEFNSDNGHLVLRDMSEYPFEISGLEGIVEFRRLWLLFLILFWVGRMGCALVQSAVGWGRRYGAEGMRAIWQGKEMGRATGKRNREGGRAEEEWDHSARALESEERGEPRELRIPRNQWVHP